MVQKPRSNEKLSYSIIFLLFGVGIIGHIVPLTHDIMIALTPIFLFGMGIFVISPIIRDKNNTILIWIGVTFLITFSIEVIGVKTGLIFGEYTYGDTLGFHLLEVPLVIGFNWVLVVLGSILVALRFSKNIYVIALISGSISTVFDIFLEPVAIELNYWTWAGGSIPVQNYIAWFIIASIFSYSFLKLELKTRSNMPVIYLLVQAFFFLSLQLSFIFKN